MLYKLLTMVRLALVTVISIISALTLLAHTSYAASLSAYTASSNVSVGNIFTVNVDVNSGGVAINTVSATVDFPTDLLEVMSVSENPSIFTLWVQNPTFSNAAGTVTFMGGLPNPGFTGQNGQILSIIFRAKKQGTASIVLSNSSVLANDGLGTDVLKAQTPASIAINSSSPAETPLKAAGSALPALPVITSTTDPQQGLWYAGTSASFSWIIPSDVTSIQTSLSKESDSVPTITYDSSVSQRTVGDLPDGTYYFHLRYTNAVGRGPTATYKVQIDSTPPEKFALDVQTEGIQNTVVLEAVDALSGIDSYAIQIDGGPATRVQSAALTAGRYVLPPQNSGQHNLTVIAYDKAGNHTESDAIFTSPGIATPTIIVTPQEAKRGDIVTIHGQTQYPDSPIAIFIQSQGMEAQMHAVRTASDGSYSLVSDPLDTAGTVSIWSELVFSTSTQSPPSDKATVRVSDTLIIQTSKTVVYSLSFILPAVLLLLGLIFLLYLGWHRFFGLKRKLEKETQDTANDVHKALAMFKDELEDQLKKLENLKEERDLNKKEEKIFKELRANIDNIDEFIEKKVRKMRMP